MRLKLTFFIIGIVCCGAVFSQTLLEGIVLDKLSKTPLVGASISIKNSFDGATSDSLGRFRFESEEKGGQTLSVSYLGYKTREWPVDLSQPQRDLKCILEENLTDIKEVVISAGSFEAGDEKKGLVLKPLDLVTIPGANGDITGALNTLPGTTVNGESGQLIVRGGAAGETRVYIDGLPVKNFYSSALPDLPVRSRFSPFQFKGTTFSSGGYSAEYGQALSAALILNTPDMPTQGGASIGVSSVGVNASKTVLKPKSAFSASLGYNNLRPYMRLIKQKVSFIAPPEGGFGLIEGRIKSGKDGIIKYGAQGTLNHVTVGYPKLAFQERDFQMGIVNKNARAFATWRQPSGEQWTFYTAAQAEANLDSYTPNTFSAFKVRNYAASGRFNATYTPNATLRWRNGSEVSWAHLENTFVQNPLDHTIAALFSEVETYLGDRIIARAGVRGERDFLLGQNRVAPRLTAAYKTGRESQVSASWGVFYQSPEDTLLLRNAALGFERAQHYILNYQISREQRIFRVEAFYKQYRELVRTISDYTNSGNGYAQGVELFFRDRKTFKWADYWVSYSFLDTRRLHRRYPVSAMPEFAARHNASFVYKYFFSKPQISANLSYTVQSGRPYFNPQSAEFLNERTPTYHNLSLQCAKLTNLFGHFTVLAVSVTNVLGSKQVFSYRFTPIPDTQPLVYAKQEIVPPAPRFVFIGCFVNIGDKKTKVTKEEALE